ncbi:fructose-bisphosphate aldolase, class I [Loktanella sp. DSM 29012]|uniref:fructose bisphosphate aldolase n=1 Tax=Loktanella sp. DSM 29012 TaxID=1881056 RepID=UPI0008B1026A|nr:fructose bisphosphate aldolase [Loktanella sp. DSM 29012]SEQ17570.1 fructose-bisphosphate aldolase, class I [Loktanella sp. DSM 29012]
MNQDMANQMRTAKGFIAALDQSGGSTPKALAAYGLSEKDWSNDDEMFDLIHAMRARIVAAPDFSGSKVLGAILFEQTMDRAFEGKPAPRHLWEDQHVVPFLKIDHGLEDTANGVQLMKPIGGLDHTLQRAYMLGVFGTKERSVIHAANPAGIEAIVAQQFDIGRQVLLHKMMPILEPEITISIPDKAAAEALLLDAMLRQLDMLPDGTEVMIKLTLPETPGQYDALVNHPKVMRVVALSGGYDLNEATARLARNPGIIASFSRALTEGLSARQEDTAFNAAIGRNIASIYAASVTG